MNRDLAHLTITSGHMSAIARSEIGQGEMAMASALLDQALACGRAQMPAPWQEYAIMAEPFGAALLVKIWHQAPPAASVPLVVFGISPRARSGRALWARLLDDPAAAIAPKGMREPPAPWCSVVLQPALFDHQAIIPVLGDLEAALAWAWLDRKAGEDR